MPIASVFLGGADSEVGEPVPKNLKIPTIRQVGKNEVRYANTTLRSIRVAGKVDSYHVKWLVDTGATCTVISDAVPVNKDLIRPVTRRPKGAGGAELDCIGTVTVKVSVGSMVREVEVYVIKGLPAIAILGTDSIQALGDSLSFDWKAKEMIIGSEHIPIECRWRSDQSISQLYVVEEQTISAGEEALVWVAADEIEETLGNRAMLIEPYQKNNLKRGFMVGKSVVTPDRQNRVPIRVISCSDHGTTLQPGSVIGCMEQVKTKRSSREAATKNSKSLADLLKEYKDVFSKSNADLGRLPEKYRFELSTETEKPVAQRARKVPHFLRDQIRSQVNEMKRNGIIRTSNSAWASPVLLVKKPNGEYRFACDYRELNKITKADRYPIGDLAAAQNTMAGARYFSTLDLRSGYHQVPMSPEATEKSAFITQEGLFEFLVLSFGLKNAPGHFSRMMDKVLMGLTWESCLVYLDDVIVWGKDEAEHLENLKKVFDRFREAGVTLRADKCTFMAPSVKYLGHVFEEGGYRPDPEKVKSLAKLKSPEDVKGVKRVLGMLSFYRRFLPNMAVVAAPMTELLKKDVEFNWSNACEESLRKLLGLLMRKTMLAFPDFSQPFILTTDACQLGLGSVLAQEREGFQVPISFASRVCRGAESNWGARELETLSLVWSIEHFREFLYGKAFVLQSDHHSLQWLLELKNPQGKFARWIEKLSEYELKVVYLPGAKNVVADTLSRHVTVENEEEEECQLIRVEEVLIEDSTWAAMQKEDKEVLEIKKWLRTGIEPKKDSVCEKVRQCLPCFSLNEAGLVVYKSPHKKNRAKRVMVPVDLIPEVLERLHDNAGHFGYERTLEAVQSQCFFVNMTTIVKKWCSSCDICGRRKGTKGGAAGCRERERVSAPWQIMDIDLMGPLTKTKQGNQYVLGCIDRFTKYLFTVPLPDKKAVTVAKGILRVNYLVGFVRKIHCDNGKEFINKLLEQALEICKIESTTSLPYTPQQNGLIERTWRTLTDRVAMRVDVTKEDWDLTLDLATLQYNTSLNSSTKETPFFLNSGRPAHFGTVFREGEEERNVSQYCEEMKEIMPDKFKEIKKIEDENIAKRVESTGKKEKKLVVYKEGDRVWYRRNVVKTKLDARWEGPYVVKKVLSDITVRLRLEERNKRIVAHINRLKPYGERVQTSEEERLATEPQVMPEGSLEVGPQLVSRQWREQEETQPTTVTRRQLTARPMRLELTRAHMPRPNMNMEVQEENQIPRNRLQDNNEDLNPTQESEQEEDNITEAERERITIRLPLHLFNRETTTERRDVDEAQGSELNGSSTESVEDSARAEPRMGGTQAQESEESDDEEEDTDKDTFYDSLEELSTTESDSEEVVKTPTKTTLSGRTTIKRSMFQAGQ